VARVANVAALPYRWRNRARLAGDVGRPAASNDFDAAIAAAREMPEPYGLMAIARAPRLSL